MKLIAGGGLVIFSRGEKKEVAAMLIGEMTYEREMEIAEIKGEWRAEARGREEREKLLEELVRKDQETARVREEMMRELARKDQEAARAEQEKEALQRQLDQLLKQQSR